jgi:hypothetical protein
MRRQVANLASLLLALSLTSCLHLNTLNHQPAMARSKAEQFADAAFIEHDLGSAYGLLSQAMRNQLSFEQFKGLISKMHPSQYPDAVNATDYEPLMGQKGMNIYLFGKTRNENFYYRFFMEGTKETDYSIGGMWRNDGPYPPSNMRKRL